MIGVHPEAQGRGYGRMLLDAVQALSEGHSTSTGVALDTENPENVPIYEHCGYRVIAETNLEGVPIWCMLRPNGTYARAVRLWCQTTTLARAATLANSSSSPRRRTLHRPGGRAHAWEAGDLLCRSHRARLSRRSRRPVDRPF